MINNKEKVVSILEYNYDGIVIMGPFGPHAAKLLSRTGSFIKWLPKSDFL
jgi:hypothetical protein